MSQHQITAIHLARAASSAGRRTVMLARLSVLAALLATVLGSSGIDAPTASAMKRWTGLPHESAAKRVLAPVKDKWLQLSRRLTSVDVTFDGKTIEKQDFYLTTKMNPLLEENPCVFCIDSKEVQDRLIFREPQSREKRPAEPLPVEPPNIEAIESGEPQSAEEKIRQAQAKQEAEEAAIRAQITASWRRAHRLATLRQVIVLSGLVGTVSFGSGLAFKALRHPLPGLTPPPVPSDEPQPASINVSAAHADGSAAVASASAVAAAVAAHAAS